MCRITRESYHGSVVFIEKSMWVRSPTLAGGRKDMFLWNRDSLQLSVIKAVKNDIGVVVNGPNKSV